jgi:hypothetical protein
MTAGPAPCQDAEIPNYPALCCRYLVKDRLDITGARWSLSGAEAILLLRTVIDNGDLDAYWAHHRQREHDRHHTNRYQQEYDLAA